MSNFILSLLGNLLVGELKAWSPRLADKLISCAVRKLPTPLQDRLHEEWSALLNDTPGDLSKLWVALSLYVKRSQIADQCEDVVEAPISPLRWDTLTAIEDAVFELAAKGKTDGEISNFTGLNRTMVEYYKVTCMQKLSGQDNIGRKDLLRFFSAGHKKSSHIIHRLVSQYRRERRWRNLEREQTKVPKQELRINKGW